MSRSDWLYPISKSAGTWWEDTDRGVTAKISLANFRDLIVPGFLGDDWWFISSNYLKVAPGDRAWIYLSGGTGVIGLASIKELEFRNGQWQLHLRFRKSASRRLCERPFPGAKVNEYVPYPRSTVTGLDDHPRLVRMLERAAGI